MSEWQLSISPEMPWKIIYSLFNLPKWHAGVVCKCRRQRVKWFGLTRRPRIWLIAALSFSVHSAMTLALISFMYSMKAFSGFFITVFLGSFSRFPSGWGFLNIQTSHNYSILNQEGCSFNNQSNTIVKWKYYPSDFILLSYFILCFLCGCFARL